MGVGGNLADLFEAAADSAPGREAVVAGTTRLTFAELDERANRLAHALAAGAGVGPGDRVGVLVGDRHEHVEVLLAAFKLRALPINLNTRYVEAEQRAVLTTSAARVVVAEPSLVDGITVPVLRLGDEYESALTGSPHERPPAQGRSGDDRYVIWTGGTTGEPKGVIWRHEDLVAAALSQLPPARRTLVACPLSHGTGQWLALATLLGAGTVLLDPSPGFEPARVLALAADERASFLVLVGDAFARPLLDLLLDAPDRWTLDALNVVVSGGAPLSPLVRSALLDALPWTVVVDGFGASETGGHGRMVAVPATGGVPTRFVVDDDTTILADDLAGHVPRDDTAAEGWLARTGPIPVGYDGDAEATARSFPVVDGVRWAVPGDRARWAVDGTVVLLGRGARTINTGGEKVHAEEVEAVLREHPAIGDAVVVGVPDDRWGERVTAVVSATGAGPITVDDLARHCAGRLAPFKVPKAVVVVDEVRRTPAGKPDVRWALDQTEGQAAQPSSSGSTGRTTTR